ncbi:iron ABC transporter permease [uncultured Microbacterium sp.]|uniref:FecCD family ABC transporter permease n=1 Tax=uncultured Microbacterium sp. TaxID=191216 RepID=UPI0026378261|nr:iron ABC transporter permease [uncultured Microbacterium sp.]
MDSPPPLRFARRRLGLIALCAILVVGVFASACIGTLSIPPQTTWNALFAFDPENTAHLLVVHQRIPRALLGVVVGLCLGVAGAVMQALTRNPLAEPGILGVNAGAAVAIAVGIAFFGITDASGYMWLGLIGAAIAGFAVYSLGGVRTGTNPVRLVLAGAALSVVLGALTQLVLVNSIDDVFDRYRHWMVGSLAGRGYEVLGSVSILAAIGLVMAMALARSLDSAMLGEDLSRALGGSPGRVWALAGLTVIILAGAATAGAGPIAFLGLAAPHLARLLAGVDHRWVLPYSGLLAAVLMVLADTLGRVIPQNGEVSVGIMVALLGGPFFVVLVRRRRMVQL